MQLSIETGVPVVTVFVQGLLSFFSPCVFPLVPLYLSYLAGGTQSVDEEGNVVYSRKKVLIHTICFVVGIGFSFFVLGLGFSALGQFFKGNRVWFARVSGIIMIWFGIYQLGILGKAQFLEKERRLSPHLEKWTMNPITAFILGFTFSFAWTPCVGPTMASVLLMAGSAKTSLTGFLLIGVYIVGFTLPFLAVGIFTGSALEFFRKHGKVMQYTVKAGAALMILMGAMTFTGWMNGVTGYLSSISNTAQSTEQQRDDSEKGLDGRETENKGESANQMEESGSKAEKEDQKHAERPVVPAPDFSLKDQYGYVHKLSDYKGKTVFLNFWATWCGPCQREMPDIQELYEKYGENSEDLVVIGVANPKSKEYPMNQDVSESEIVEFLEERGYRYPTIMDPSGEVFRQYGITSFPTTFMIDKEGNVYGYVTGTLTADMIEDIVKQTMENGEK